MKKLVLLFMFTGLTAFAAEKEQIYGPVKTGDMLWNIASSVRPDPNLDRYQVMMALLAINPDAFKIPCNINSLQVGKVLKTPNLAEIQRLTAKQALAEFERQKTVWQASRQSGQAIVCAETESVSKIDSNIIEPIESVDEQTVFIENAEATIPAVLSTDEAFDQFIPSTPIHPVVIPTSQISITPISLDALIIQDLTTLISQPITTIPISIVAFAFSLLYLVALLVIGLLNILFRFIKQDHEKKTTTPEDKFAHLATSTNNNVTPVDEVKEKLAIIRSYLADGEEVTLHHLLQEVMKKGNHEQQTEARQLIEINRKIQALSQKCLPNDELPETLSHQTYDNRINLTDNVKVVQDRTTTFLESESYPRPITRYL